MALAIYITKYTLAEIPCCVVLAQDPSELSVPIVCVSPEMVNMPLL